jgi:hypothetical protein
LKKSRELIESPRVVGSFFGIAVLLVVVRSVLEAATSLRAASEVCYISAQAFNYAEDAEMSHTSVQNVVLRIGLHELTRPKERAEDWIWMIDHTIQAGTTKCLIVLGIRHANYLAINRPLEHRDMQVLSLQPVEVSSGTIVEAQLEALVSQVGKPLSILSDRGSDLKKGVELLGEKHSGIISLYDIVHIVSRMSEKIMNADSRWPAYRQACCRCANATRQTTLAHMKPPTPKSKARYMHIDEEVRWGARSLAILDQARNGKLSCEQKAQLSLDELEKQLGWLDEYRQSLIQWEAITHIVKKSCRLVRTCGYGAALQQRIAAELGEWKDLTVSALVKDIVTHCEQSSQLVGLRGRLPGSTEVLESVIGKGKQLAGSHPIGSFTRQLLALASAVVTPTAEYVRASLSTCRIKHLKRWCLENLPVSMQANRRRDLAPTEAEQKLRKQLSVQSPNF